MGVWAAISASLNAVPAWVVESMGVRAANRNLLRAVLS